MFGSTSAAIGSVFGTGGMLFVDVDLRVDEEIDVVDSLLTKASVDTMKMPKCMNCSFMRIANYD